MPVSNASANNDAANSHSKVTAQPMINEVYVFSLNDKP
eukprot:CAMPEP_0177548948 /NCGR_PEP_ID=MMETSP0369-20130122/64751_1 /TAXON_ID=447022 ORGANISM="Scrippsiella hangoei-like, Strain SHHI-4" /NCGR_SAMPLE_ID=MMETSP0369 /ASSEMBLY_ACC=CAM_ASM_000364 /LENGTH=37 /DNA_ID= /DNA_START= /DNA_END= /DNA_ORIENTATION=